MRLADIEHLQWTGSWQPITNDVERQFLGSELMTELHVEHPLAGLIVTALARRTDADEILFAVWSAPPQLAVVHLTFAEEHSPEYPAFELYASVEEWLSGRE